MNVSDIEEIIDNESLSKNQIILKLKLIILKSKIKKGDVFYLNQFNGVHERGHKIKVCKFNDKEVFYKYGDLFVSNPYSYLSEFPEDYIFAAKESNALDQSLSDRLRFPSNKIKGEWFSTTELSKRINIDIDLVYLGKYLKKRCLLQKKSDGLNKYFIDVLK